MQFLFCIKKSTTTKALSPIYFKFGDHFISLTHALLKAHFPIATSVFGQNIFFYYALFHSN